MTDCVCILLAQNLRGYSQCVAVGVNREAALTYAYFQIRECLTF
jgi:hypothetical protein